jgi:hypothetical protein
MSGAMSKAMRASPVVIVLGLAACGSGDAPPPIPEMPSYATDVQPIFVAHCVRCHGANGMLNDGLHDDGTPSAVGPPGLCYLSNYADQGDCSDAGVAAGACKRGAHYCGTATGDPPDSFISAYLIELTQDQGGMPPLPLPAVGDRDKEIVRRWLVNPIP